MGRGLLARGCGGLGLGLGPRAVRRGVCSELDVSGRLHPGARACEGTQGPGHVRGGLHPGARTHEG